MWDVGAARDFIAAVATNWWALASFVSAVLWIVSQASGKPEHGNIPRPLLPALVIIFLFLGAYQAFVSKREEALASDKGKKTAEGERDSARGERNAARARVTELQNTPAQKELAELRERVDEFQGVREELGAERQARAHLEDQLNAIRAKEAPRFLTDDAERAIGAFLREFGSPEPIDIHYSRGCDDCRGLAAAFLRGLRLADWTAPEYGETALMASPGIWLSSGTEYDDDRAALFRDFLSGVTGMTCQYMRHPGTGLKLVVGPRGGE